MQLLIQALIGPFGALIMVLGGLGAILLTPFGIALVVYAAIKNRDEKWYYFVGFGLPFSLLLVSVAMFVLRSILATHYPAPFSELPA